MQYFAPTLLFCAGFLASCQVQEKNLPDYFPPAPLPDTLYFEIHFSETEQNGDTLANSMFFGALPQEFLDEIEYAADTAESVVLARSRFRLDEQYDGLLADIRYVWFQHQSLLIYDRKAKRFTDRITVAEWYGGEGGQILTGAWLLDLDGDGQRELVQRQTSHSMRVEGDVVQEAYEDYVTLWRLKKGKFLETPAPDTAALIRQFPLPNPWE